MKPEADTGTDSGLAVRAAAIASVGAAVIHLAVTPAHWREWLPSGIFFASIAVFQLIWAVLAWTRPPTVLLAAGVVANTVTAALWVWSHTAGAPFGPHIGEAEAVQAAGICALLLECYVVMGAAWALMRRDRPEQVSGFGSALVLLGANTVIATAVTVGVVSSLQSHDHHGPAEAQSEVHAPSAGRTDNHAETPPAQSDSAHSSDGAHHHDE